VHVGFYEDIDGQVFPKAVSKWLDKWKRPADVSNSKHLAVVDLDTVEVDGKPKIGGKSGRIFKGALYFGHPHFEWLMGQFLVIQQIQAHISKGHYLFELIHPQSGGMPVVTASGQYKIKLHLYDGWRAVTVDDQVPVDLFGRPLVVACRPFQLWPILLSKALLKVMAAYQILECQASHQVCSVVTYYFCRHSIWILRYSNSNRTVALCPAS
jgi:hypothetical protein